jgi:hypothetical protein
MNFKGNSHQTQFLFSNWVLLKLMTQEFNLSRGLHLIYFGLDKVIHAVQPPVLFTS